MHLYNLIVLSYNLTSTQAFFTPLHAKKDTFFVSTQCLYTQLQNILTSRSQTSKLGGFF